MTWFRRRDPTAQIRQMLLDLSKQLRGREEELAECRKVIARLEAFHHRHFDAEWPFTTNETIVLPPMRPTRKPALTLSRLDEPNNPPCYIANMCQMTRQCANYCRQHETAIIDAVVEPPGGAA